MAKPRKPGKRERQKARMAPGAPQRVCKTRNCSTILSKYNDDEICNKCYRNIPIHKRPISGL